MHLSRPKLFKNIHSTLHFFKRVQSCGVVIIFLLIQMINLTAQTDNYWSWNFNTPSTLLAGAVVGGAAGPSGIFYNPALIDHDNTASLSISASIITFQVLKLKNAAGSGVDARNINLTIQPRFLSYVLPIKNKKLGVEIALVSPVSENVEYHIQHSHTLDIIKRIEGPEIYTGTLDYFRKFEDTWGGIGFSYKLSENFYIGGSAFGSYKRMKYENRQSVQAFQKTDSIIVNQTLGPAYFAFRSFEEDLSYWDVSMVLKLGAQYTTKNERFSVGVNLSMPNIPILGQADVRKGYRVSNVYDNTSDSFIANEIIIVNEENAKTRVKNPFSAALGIQFFTKEKENFISLTVEYFNKISPYPIIETSGDSANEIPEYFVGLGIDEFLPYYFEGNPVTNIAVGTRQTLTPNLYIFGGFRTDFTSGTKDNVRYVGNRFKTAQIHMDKYHITLGPILNINRSEIVTGVQYTY